MALDSTSGSGVASYQYLTDEGWKFIDNVAVKKVLLTAPVAAA
jgi:hypothetical protein